jgi:long-chain acyl-CoA synthetase
MTTSGSTGSPKLVRLSYGNLAANAGAIATYLAIGAEDRAITTLPVNYVYGLSVVNSHLHAGASIVLSTASLTEKRFWELLKAQRATTFSGVPYTFELLHRLGWSRMNLPSLKVLTQAGGKLNASLVREFASQCQARGIRFYVMYGAAEATARMSYLPPSMVMDKAASIGIAIPGGEFTLEGPDNSPIDKPETVGELIYRGPNVSLGYAECRRDLALGDERGGGMGMASIRSLGGGAAS